MMSRTCCVYCGVRIQGSNYHGAACATAVACPRHRYLFALDPTFTVDNSVEGGEK